MSSMMSGIRREFLIVKDDISALNDVISRLEQIVREIAVKVDVSTAPLDTASDSAGFASLAPNQNSSQGYYATPVAQQGQVQVQGQSTISGGLRRR